MKAANDDPRHVVAVGHDRAGVGGGRRSGCELVERKTAMTKQDRKCADCGKRGVIRAEGVGWLCSACVTERINAPRNVALTEAYDDMAEHLDKGGKLS